MRLTSALGSGDVLTWLVVLISVAVAAWRARRFRQRMRVPSSGRDCMACGSAELEWLGPGAYRCQGCGYEGGPGMAALIEQRAAAAYQAMDPQQRQPAALKLLHDALHTLMGAQAGVAGLQTAALRGAEDLDEARRIMGGVVDVPGFGPFDPKPLADQLRMIPGDPDTPFDREDEQRTFRMETVLGRVRDTLASALDHTQSPRPG